jgi:hypothetical protein
MPGNFWINQNPQIFLQPDVGTLLVYARQSTVPSDIGRENGGKLSL